MEFQKKLRTTVISLGACLLASQAHAIAISDATIQNPTGGLEPSSAAVLEKGKIKNANINALTGLFAGDAWTLLDRTNKASKPFNDVNFLLAADTGQRSGEWALSWDGFDFPAYMDYVLVLKSGKQWSAYLFDSASLVADSQDVAGTFKISWLNKKGKIAKLRHASIFGRIGEAPVILSDGDRGTGGDRGTSRDGGTGRDSGTGEEGGTVGNGSTGDGDGSAGGGARVGDAAANAVPIPGTLALLVTGIAVGRRQRRQKN